MDEQLAALFAEKLAEFGLRFSESVTLSDVPFKALTQVTLSHGCGNAVYKVGYADILTSYSLGWILPHIQSGEKVLLLGPRVTERSAERLRQMGINYLDAAGNAYISFDGVLIDIRGRRSQDLAISVETGKAKGEVNLFSTKRAQVIFVLLVWPELLSEPIRVIAKTAGVSVGRAQETIDLLRRLDFLDHRRQLIKSRKKVLIDQWSAAFPTGIGAAGKALHFSGNWQNLNALDSPVYISGDAAFHELLKPETAVFYSEEIPYELIRANRWRRDDSRPNIFLRKQFWKDPYIEVKNGLHTAPWLLIYADLLASNDSRQREAAKQLREQHD